MAKTPQGAPGYCKWWMERWYGSSLRRRHLKTAMRRGIYREFWDLCMSSPDPGAAVDSAGEPYTETELAREIGCRPSQLREVLEVLISQGKVVLECQSSVRPVLDQCQTNAGPVLRLCQSSVEMSLPDHWKYNRLHGAPSDMPPKNPAPNQNQNQNQSNPLTPFAEEGGMGPPPSAPDSSTIGAKVAGFRLQYKRAFPDPNPAVPAPIPRSWDDEAAGWDTAFIQSPELPKLLTQARGAIEEKFWGPGSFAKWLEGRHVKPTETPAQKANAKLMRGLEV